VSFSSNTGSRRCVQHIKVGAVVIVTDQLDGSHATLEARPGVMKGTREFGTATLQTPGTEPR
jgi:hypothetical protein